MNDAVCPDKTSLITLLDLVRFGLNCAAKAFSDGRVADGQLLLNQTASLLDEKGDA